MPVYNSDVANIFNQIADLLEIEGANPYRVRAYRDAARTIATLSGNVADRVEEGEDLTELPGIGEDLAGKIEEQVEKALSDFFYRETKRRPVVTSAVIED